MFFNRFQSNLGKIFVLPYCTFLQNFIAFGQILGLGFFYGPNPNSQLGVNRGVRVLVKELI